MNQALNPFSIKKYWKDQFPPDIKYYKQNKLRFTDSYFPPNRNSFISCDQNGFYIDSLKGYEYLEQMERKIPGFVNRIIWKRATEFKKNWVLMGNKFEKKDVIQGNIGDCYFLSALLSLTQYPYLLSEKFRTKKFNEEGYYEMIFFIDGEWQIVFVDDYLPFDPEQEELVGARSEQNELWAILLEKAWFKINGGYTNSFSGIFSEAISALTGFPTEIFDHKEIENENNIFNLYKSIEKGYNEGAIMACGTDNNGLGIEIFGLIPNHCYSIICPQKWEERNIYLLKLKNPWGKNKWSGNWSEYSLSWTPELKAYFNYTNNSDGIMWIDLNDFINYFDNTFICHLLYGALFKYFYFEYENYFRKPVVFNLYLGERAITSISILYKNRRFNRELNNVTHPFLLLLCKYNENKTIEKIWIKWDCQDEINLVRILDSGYYCIWLYCPLNQIKGDPNFKYTLQISSLSQYEIEFIGLDDNFSLIQYIATNNFSYINSNKLNSAENYLITSNEQLFSNGLFNTLIFNKTPNPMQITAIDDGIKNCQLFPPYEGKYSFKIIVPPYENAAILGIRLSYSSGAFNIKTQVILKIGEHNKWNFNTQTINKGNAFTNYLKFNISSNSLANNSLRNKEYTFIHREIAKNLPIFESKNFSGEESLKQSLRLNEDLSPNNLISLYPYEFNLLFKMFPKSNSPNIQKMWTKIKNNSGNYIGQINRINGELEGRGVFFWNIGTKYIGHFSKNTLQGNGILIDKNNRKIFEGNFYSNKKNGFGRFYYNNIEYYEGDFINDKIEGNGAYHFSNGDIWEGTFKNRKKNGVGILLRVNGEIFLTEYENNNFMGAIQLNNEEINYIQNLRKKDKDILWKLIKVNPIDQRNVINIKKQALVAAFQIYKKKQELSSSIIVYQ